MYALSGVTVVESGQDLAVAFAGRLLRMLGATVLVTRERHRELVPHALAAFLDHAKTPAAGRDLGQLLAGAQVWLSSDPAPAHERASLVHVVLTPYGAEGPWAGRAGSAFTGSALGGLLHLCGEAEREPLKNGGLVLEFQAGLFATIGALAGLLKLEAGRGGGRVETSYLESAIAFQERGDIAWTHTADDWKRARRHEVGHPFTVFPCADGYVTIAIGPARQWENLCLLIGKPEWAQDVELIMNKRANADLIDEALIPWLASRKSADVVRECQEFFVPCGPVLTAHEVLQDAQFRERQFFQSMQLLGQAFEVPGAPFRLEGAFDPAAWAAAPGAAR
ncbi:MAG: CoA transferase [Dehalococcoidia bacterium]|nr:CoA transferase [Dehalococcoidia bacterium]